MSFHDIRFPARLSFGSHGGPERRTDVVTLANGHEERNSPWAHSRRRYDAGIGMRSLDDIEELIAFFEARHGQLHGFRWKDWSDFKSCKPSQAIGREDQVIATGDGETTVFQLNKSYRSGDQTYVRPIQKPAPGSVIVAVHGVDQHEGTHFDLDDATGVLTFYAPPFEGAIISAGFEFDVPVRFDIDRIQTSMANFQAGDAPSVPVVEIRV